jgi:hypothetical protein
MLLELAQLVLLSVVVVVVHIIQVQVATQAELVLVRMHQQVAATEPIDKINTAVELVDPDQAEILTYTPAADIATMLGMHRLLPKDSLVAVQLVATRTVANLDTTTKAILP